MSAPFRTVWFWLDRVELDARGGEAGYLASVFARPTGQWCRDHGYRVTAVRWKRIAAAPGVWQVGLHATLAEGAFDAPGFATLLDPVAPHMRGFFDLDGRAVAGSSLAEAA